MSKPLDAIARPGAHHDFRPFAVIRESEPLSVAMGEERGHSLEPWSMKCRNCGQEFTEINRQVQLGGSIMCLRGCTTAPLTRRTRVYVAGPITSSGNLLLNVRRALYAGTTLLRRGYAPYVPHLTCYWEIVAPEDFTYEDWLALDVEFLLACDVLLRLDGASKGADREVKIAQEHNITVYWSMDTLLAGVSPRRALVQS